MSNKGKYQEHAPKPAVETLDGDAITFPDDESAMKYAERHKVRKCGQYFPGTDEVIE